MERWENTRIEPITLIVDIISNLWVILLGAIAAALLAYIVVSERYEPRYETSATFAVSSKTNANAINNLTAANEMTKTFRTILQSHTMNRIICEELEVDSIDAEISCNVLGETNLMILTVSANTSKEAVEVIRVIMNNYEKVSYFALGNATMLVLEEPSIPMHPVNTLNVRSDMKTVFRYAILALIAVFALLSYFKDTIKQEKDVEKKLDTRCLGVIPFERKYKTIKELVEHKKCALLVSNPIAGFAFVEGYRKFATKVDYQMQKNALKAVVVTSVSENEGKSTVATNLALSLAAQSKKVLLMEGDLRRPSQFLICGEEPQENEEVGEYIKGALKYNDIVKKSRIPNLSLVLGKNCYSTSTEMLHRKEMKELIERAKEQFDYVIIDSSPIGVIGDAEILAEYAGAVVFVTRQNMVLAEDINDAMDSFRSHDTKVLGVLLNGVLGADVIPGGDRYGNYGNYIKAGDINRYE